jgi:ArsR family transcriptional regulator
MSLPSPGPSLVPDPSSLPRPGGGADPTAADTGAVCCPRPGTPLGEQQASAVAAMLKVVADPTRVRLLSMIASSPDGEVCVCDLTAPLGLTQPTVSHHLKQLLDAGMVHRDKRGVWAYYRLAPAALADLGALVACAFTRTGTPQRAASSS